MELDYIFVYGSLRKSFAHRLHEVLVQHAEYAADAWIQGKLYEIDGYPGAIQTACEGDRVYGELYKTTSLVVVLEKFDEYEECSPAFAQPHEYVRKLIPVMDAEQHVVLAWAYIFNRATTGLLQINSGDYLEFVDGKSVSTAGHTKMEITPVTE